MLLRSIAPFTFFLFAVSASADPFVYVIGGIGTANQGQFGTVDVATGAFQQVGPNTPEGPFGLAAGPNGSLLTLTYSGNLDSINPATGVTTLVGASGLADCATPGSPCGPTSAGTLGAFAGKIYATDFQNTLYVVNPLTGTATLLAHTGIPTIPFVPGSLNPDGTINFFDEAMWGAGGKLYATFDALSFDLNTFTVASVAVAPELYQIDPVTGLAMVIGPTDLGIGGVADVNGTSYAFNDLTNQVVKLDLANGNTTFVSNFDPAAGVIQGASPVVPEPASIMFVGLGIAGLFICRVRRRHFSIQSRGAFQSSA